MARPEKKEQIMPVDKDTEKKVIEHLDEKLGKRLTCPVCGHQEWSLNDHFMQLDEFGPDRPAFGKYKIFPVIVLTCQHCGHVLLFGALALGVIERPPKDEDDG
jgi:transcription elongation factor Elf1